MAVIADRSVSRCDNIVTELLDFAHSRELQMESRQFDEWVGDVLREYESGDGDVRIQCDLRCDATLAFDTGRLQRALINLLDNAHQAIRDADYALTDGRLSIATRRCGTSVEIAVADNGVGIEQDDIERVFEPLFSTRSFGVGLGLPMVRQVVEAHEGGIGLKSAPGVGTEVTVWLPLQNVEERA